MEAINKEVHKAYEIVKNGGVILYPTDTVWGLGCDATNEIAVQRIYEIKKRVESRSMIVLVNSDRLLYQVFREIPQIAFDVLNCSDKPTTLVLDAPKMVAKNLISEDNSLGIRIVTQPFCYKLIERLKKPLVSTSANLSGAPTPTQFSEISKEIIESVDYVVQLDRDKICKKASTIIKLTQDAQVKILRK